MSKPVYEIPVTGPEGAKNGASGFSAPATPPELQPQPADYPPPGSFAPSGAGIGAPVGPIYASVSFPPPAESAFPPPQESSFPAAFFPPPAGSVPPPAAESFPPPAPAAPVYSAPPAPAAPVYSAPPAPAAPAPAAPAPAAPVYTAPPAPAAPVYTAPPVAVPTQAAPTVPAPTVPAPTVPEVVQPDDESDEARAARAAADPALLRALQEVVMAAASDLHLTANAQPMLRIDGGLRPIEGSEVWSRDRVAKAIMSILTPAQRETFDEKLELDLAFTLSANARFRVNVYQQRGAIGAAFRLIPTGIVQLHELGLPEAIGRFAGLPRGLVLVTGPTGSGKSTTLAAIIDVVNRTRADHIVTVEDPIEFLHTNRKSLVNQREVGSDTHSFANALKHVLRQDPDVILIGELRDLETISVALTAAETGHLVFATLHTQDAAQTIDRVIDVFPPHQQGQVRAQLAATLQGVVSQTLLKRAQGTGRAVATEILVTTSAVANLIREGKTYQLTSAMQAGRDLGMHTMDQHLADLVNAGVVSHATALEKVHDREGFGRLIHREMSTGNQSMSAGVDFGDAFSKGI